MTDKFKTITFTTKNKREFNKMKKKLDKAKNIDIIKINNEKVEMVHATITLKSFLLSNFVEPYPIFLFFYFISLCILHYPITVGF